MKDIKASVVVCTYKRAGYLEALIEKLTRQTFPADQYEIIIVDNSSPDNTPAVVKTLIEKNKNISIRYILEKQQGVAFARNRGFKESQGQYVVYIDDDELPGNPNWLSNMVTVLETYKADSVGGPIELEFRDIPPYWLTKQFRGWLGSFLPTQAEPYQYYSPLFSGNTGIRRNVLVELEGFDQNLGRKGNQLSAGEDTDFSLRLLEKGKTVFIAPNAEVKHIIESERLNKSYFFKLQKGIIISDMPIYKQLSFNKQLLLLIKTIVELFGNTIVFIIGIISVRYWFLAFLYLYRSLLKLLVVLSVIIKTNRVSSR